MMITLVGMLLLAAASASGLTFDELAARVDLVESVRLADLQVRAAEQEVRSAMRPGDLSFGLTPEAMTSFDEAGIRSASVSAGATLSFPLGLSGDALERVLRVADDVEAARRALVSAREQAVVRLYSLYQAVWLAQEQLVLLDAELVVAELRYRIAQSRFNEGTITLATLGGVSESFQKAQTARDQGSLAQRLSWLELAFAIGLNPSDQLQVDAYREFTDEPPRPPELSEWAIDNDRAVIDQRAAIAAIERELGSPQSPYSVGTARLQMSLSDHSVSAAYSPLNRSVSLGYSTPDLTIVESGPPREVAPVQIGVSASFSWNATGRDEESQAAARIQLERELVRLQSLSDAIDFSIRSTYQQLHRADGAVDQAERAVDAAVAQEQVIRARAEAGQVGEVDLVEAAVAVDRARYNLVAAHIARERSVMAVVLAASYFTMHYPSLSGNGEAIDE